MAIQGKCQPPKNRIDTQEAHRDDVRVFAEEEHGEPKAAVLGVVAADQFLLALRQVERQAVRLGQRAGEENQAGQRLVPEVPLPEAAVGLLQSGSAPG